MDIRIIPSVQSTSPDGGRKKQSDIPAKLTEVHGRVVRVRLPEAGEGDGTILVVRTDLGIRDVSHFANRDIIIKK